jgi:glyoxylate reductase
MGQKLLYFLSYPLGQIQDLFKDSKEPLEISRGGLQKEKTHEEILEAVKDATIIILAPASPYLTRDVLEDSKELKFIQFISIGYENIDMEAATDLGIPVANNPGFNARAVAEHTIMLILMCLRKILYVHRRTLERGWSIPELNRFYDKNLEFRGKTLGIIGLGSTGMEVARLARVFEPRILYHRRTRLTAGEEMELGVEYRSLERLLSESDIVTLHVPLTDETRGMIGSDEIALMKDGAILVNVAREGIVDEYAAAEALKSGKLSSAAFDVFNYVVKDGLYVTDSPLTECETFIISPHTAGASRESRETQVKQWTEYVCRYLNGEKPLYLVNDVWSQK